MSSEFAIAGVTAVLQSLLNDVYNHPASPFGNITVSAVAPDIVQSSVGTSTDANLRVNLFLHQVTFNAAWRNVDLPRLSHDGTTRLTNQPLALDLHYLITAYAPEDSRAEALLGYAVLFLHQNPILERGQITNAMAALGTLSPSYTGPFGNALSTSGLADQVELIKITPATMGREELAWLWTALKADYRPTFPFQASVVLIQPQNPTVSALPVLQRSIAVVPGMSSLTSAEPSNGQPAATLTDTITVRGSGLSGAGSVTLANQQWGIHQLVSPLLNPSGRSFQFTFPAVDLPVGVYTVSAQIPVASQLFSTNSVPLAIAPAIVPASVPATLPGGANVAVSISCTPTLRPGQQVSLIIGSQQAPAEDFTAPTTAPFFTFQSLQPTAAAVPVRLRVDGIDSPVVDLTSKPPKFSGPMVQVT